MAAPIALRKTTRAITPREVYTPSKTELAMRYTLNEKKALEKKKEAAHRVNDIEIELKHGTLVMTFKAGAYELYKNAIYSFYAQSATRTYRREQIKTSKTNKNTIQKAIVEESLSVKVNGHRRQSFRINLFHSTSRINVNGWLYQIFINEDLPKICASINNEAVKIVNGKILDFCNSALTEQRISNTINTETTETDNTNQTNRPLTLAIDYGDTDDGESNETDRRQVNIKCQVCEQMVEKKEDSIECSSCTMWFHKQCTKLTDIEFESHIETEALTYICHFCENLEKDEHIANNHIDKHHITTSFVDIEPDTINFDREGTSSPVIDTPTGSNDIDTMHSKTATNLDQHMIPSTNVVPGMSGDRDHDETNLKNFSQNLQEERNEDIHVSREEDTIPKTMISQASDDKNTKNQHELQEPHMTKLKTRKVKKRDACDQEEQISALKARIVMIEELNRDYENTIQLLQRKLGRQALGTLDPPAPLNIDITAKAQDLESTFNNRLEITRLEFEHKLEMQEQKFSHQLEIIELRTKLDIMGHYSNRQTNHENPNMEARNRQSDTNNVQLHTTYPHHYYMANAPPRPSARPAYTSGQQQQAHQPIQHQHNGVQGMSQPPVIPLQHVREATSQPQLFAYQHVPPPHAMQLPHGQPQQPVMTHRHRNILQQQNTKILLTNQHGYYTEKRNTNHQQYHSGRSDKPQMTTRNVDRHEKQQQVCTIAHQREMKHQNNNIDIEQKQNTMSQENNNQQQQCDPKNGKNQTTVSTEHAESNQKEKEQEEHNEKSFLEYGRASTRKDIPETL